MDGDAASIIPERRGEIPAGAGPTASIAPQGAVLPILVAISACHLINDMMQALLPSIYPQLKANLGLNFGQIGLVTFTYQMTGSLLQPFVGIYADRRPTPFALPAGTLFSLAGLALLSAARSFPVVLVAAAFVGMGSSVFHPEGSRVARMAGGARHGLAQSLFQVGGNAGQALGPLAAALVVVRWGQSSVAMFALLALLSCAILWNVAQWYRAHGMSRLAANHRSAPLPVARADATRGIAVLLALIFSKYVYIASNVSYLSFYLIHRFGVSVQSAQLHLFAFLGATAVGTLLGGPLGDRFGRKRVIWVSILGTLPFTLALPHADLFWTMPLIVAVGLVLASAFPAIVVFAQELVPGRTGLISGLFFGFSFGMSGIGAAALGWLADRKGIEAVYEVCAFLPLIGLLCALLPDLGRRRSSVRSAVEAE